MSMRRAPHSPQNFWEEEEKRVPHSGQNLAFLEAVEGRRWGGDVLDEGLEREDDVLYEGREAGVVEEKSSGWSARSERREERWRGWRDERLDGCWRRVEEGGV